MLPLIPQDKANHFAYGTAVAIMAKVATQFYLPEYSQFAGVVASSIVGVLKEIVDFVLNKLAERKGLPPPHGVEAMDAFATALGGVATITF